MSIRSSRPRAGGGKEGKEITRRLELHDKRVKELMTKGMSKEAADKQSYKEITQGR